MKSDYEAYRRWLILGDSTCGYQEVPCGRCKACKRRRQNSWAFRIQKESEISRSTFFLTLTLREECLVYGAGGDATLVKSDLSLFLKMFRQNYCRYFGVSDSGVRFYGCGEYGDTFGRPHYHVMLFFRSDCSKDLCEKFALAAWHKGFVKVDPFTLGRSRYVAKYCCKIDGVDYDGKGVQPPFALMSRRPGIGDCYRTLENIIAYQQSGAHLVVDSKGVRQAMPRYYSEFFFSREQREAYGNSVAALERAKELLEPSTDPQAFFVTEFGLINQQQSFNYGKTKAINKKGFYRILQEESDLGSSE